MIENETPEKGGGELTRKQERALATVLASPTIEQAARGAGVPDSTLWRWLKLPEFDRRLREARARVVAHAVGSLQQAASEAVETLRAKLKSGDERIQLGAAKTILQMAVHAHEQEQLVERLKQLEAIVNELGEQNRKVGAETWPPPAAGLGRPAPAGA